MIRQIASLTALASLLMILWAHMAVGEAQIAQRLVTLYGPGQALVLARQGGDGLLLGLVPQQIRWAIVYLAGGLITGLVARLAVRTWAKKDVVDSESRVAVTDEAGGRYVMFGVPFAHAPSAPQWTIADVSEVAGIDQASTIEIELLGAYKAGGQPADTQGYHGVSLFEHCTATWRSAVEQSGPCTLESILALAHDAGKMVSMKKGDDGTWVRLTPKHEMYNAEAIRRLPSYWSMPAGERELIMLALNYMAGGVAAKDVPIEVVNAVQRVHIHDVRTTSNETTDRRAGEIDRSQLIKAVIELSKEPPADWNINRSQSSSAPAGAIHISDGVLLVAGRALRTALAQRIEPATAAALSLHLPASDWHDSYTEIAAAVQKAGLGQRIVNNVASESGWFAVRVGQAKMPHALAIRTDTSAATRGRWGVNQLEIVLTETRK